MTTTANIIRSSLLGHVERVNKLLTVRPIRSVYGFYYTFILIYLYLNIHYYISLSYLSHVLRYQGEVGDVVVGRVVEVNMGKLEGETGGGGRWLVDVHSAQLAVLAPGPAANGACVHSRTGFTCAIISRRLTSYVYTMFTTHFRKFYN